MNEQRKKLYLYLARQLYGLRIADNKVDGDILAELTALRVLGTDQVAALLRTWPSKMAHDLSEAEPLFHTMSSDDMKRWYTAFKHRIKMEAVRIYDVPWVDPNNCG